jgi:hypothetical protein
MQQEPIPRKPTIYIDDQRTCGEFLVRPLVLTDSPVAAYADMAADSDCEAEAGEWLGAVSVELLLNNACLSGSR